MSVAEAQDQRQAGLWLFLYFAANLFLTLHNKWVLSNLHFNFPWTLTALHTAVSGAGSFLLLKFAYRLPLNNLDYKIWIRLLLFSILYAVNIAISNVSLAYVSLAFHQLVRSATPVFTVIMELILFNKQRSARVYWALLPVVLGICLATVDEFSDISFSMTGLALTVFGVLLSCVKGIVTNMLLVGSLRLHPLELIWRMAVPSVLQCLVYGAVFGEIQALPEFFYPKLNGRSLSYNYSATSKIGMNCLLAMWLNWVSFTANKKTSALTMTVAGNVKQALSIILAIYVFGSRVTILNCIGVLIALLGGAWYSYESRREQQRMLFEKEGTRLLAIQ